MLLAERMNKVRIYVSKSYIDDVMFKLGEAGMIHQTEIRESLKDLEGYVHPIESSERLFKLSSILSRIEMLISSLKLENETIPERAKVERFLSNKDLERLEAESTRIEEEHSRIVSQLTEFEKQEGTEEKTEQISELTAELDKLATESKVQLLVNRERIEVARKIEEAKTRVGETSRTFVIEGWVPEKKMEDLKRVVQEASFGFCAFVSLEIAPQEGHGGEEAKAPPTLLRNPRIAYVYEKIATAFGVPNYREVDPSVFMLFSFPIIFGLMFGDVGQGSVLLVLTLLLYMLKRRNLKTSEIFSYLIQGSPLLVMCSISAIFFGFLYGEFFGFEMYNEEAAHYFPLLEEGFRSLTGISLSHTIQGASHSLEAAISSILGLPIRIPFPFSPFEDPSTMLLLSIYVAIVQISFGLVLGLINEVRNRRFKQAVIGPGIWLWFYWSFAYLLIRYGSKIFSVIFERMDIMGIYLVLPASTMILAQVAVHKMDGFGHALESLIASISNTISYGRILALALAHGAFSRILLMFLGLEGMLMMIVGFVMWAAFTFLLIMCFEFLLSFIHTLRLHWVEWFLKFYSGNGFQYRPFVITRRFTMV